MPKLAKETRDIHARLTTQISDYIDSSIDSDQFERLKYRLKSELTPKARNEANNTLEILEALERKGFVQPGKYENLLKILDEFDKRIRQDIIDPAMEEISLNTEDLQSTLTNSKDDTPNNDKPSRTKKRKTEIALPDHPDHAYDSSSEQKGLMLIINMPKDRAGSADDVEKLDSFFSSTFRFDVERIIDQTKEDLLKEILEIRDAHMKNKRMARKYYCFVCVVMSHGNEKGICTKDDKMVTIDEITKNFKNTEVTEFLGKPKVFIVQACRGCSTQPLVESDDLGDKFVSLPDDADMLIAYATTPGYKSFRTVYSDIGAWFIHALLDVLEEQYKEQHLEEMLITVRHKLATEDVYRTNEYRQMPCVWTTLTKRLYLK